MSRTGSAIITAAKGAIGDRQSGVIGGIAINTVALDALNNALLDVAKDVNLPALERVINVSLTSSAYQYAMPTSDGSNTVRIKNFLGARILPSGETTDYPVRRLTRYSAVHRYATPNSSFKGRPVGYRVFANSIDFFPYPDGAYTFSLLCDIWPTYFTAATLSSEHELGMEWDFFLEHFVIAHLFMKLQQIEESAFWLGMANKLKGDLISTLRDKSDLRMTPSGEASFSPYDIDYSTIPAETYRDLSTGQVIEL